MVNLAKRRTKGARELTLRIDADVYALITLDATERKRDKHAVVEEAVRHQKKLGLDAKLVALIETMANLQRQPADVWLRDLLETRYEVLRPREEANPLAMPILRMDQKKSGRAP